MLMRALLICEPSTPIAYDLTVLENHNHIPNYPTDVFLRRCSQKTGYSIGCVLRCLFHSTLHQPYIRQFPTALMKAASFDYFPLTFLHQVRKRRLPSVFWGGQSLKYSITTSFSFWLQTLYIPIDISIKLTFDCLPESSSGFDLSIYM